MVTVHRTKVFTTLCWSLFLALNAAYILFGFCCLITPLQSHQFYTFGYGEFETAGELFTGWVQEQRSQPMSSAEKAKSWFGASNIFTYTYTPLELATIGVLSVSNPTTLFQIYKRHKRKMALKM